MSSPSPTSAQSNSSTAAHATLAPPAETVRSCADRERRLTEYIRAHTGEDIAVRLSPDVPTAFVVPASEEALIESDNGGFSDDEARQLAESVDADYLVVISTHPANVDNLPIDDQLTADRAQQFGSALHELGHIRYTAIADAAALLKERVDEDHQEFVHGLWNACEDAAIEHQLRLDQSQIAADRIELVRRSISTHAEEYQIGESCAFTFRDAIETALYDEGIYDTGVRDALCDPDDERIVFAGEADRQAYEQVADSISDLIATVLSTPNSVERIEHILDWWETVVKPLLDPPQQNQQEAGQPDPDGATGESSADASSSSNSSSSSASSTDGEPEKSTEESTDADHSSAENEARQTSESASDSSSSEDDPDSSSREESATPDEMGETDESEGSGDSQATNQPDPDAINTDQRQSHPGADVLDYPDIGDDEDADALRQPGPNSEDESESESESAGDGGGEEESDSQSPREATDDQQATEEDRDNDQTADATGDAPSDTATETAGDTEADSEDDGRENADTVGGSDADTGSDEVGDTDATADSGTDAGNSEETPGSDGGQSTQNDDRCANHGETTDVAGESDGQGSEGESEGQPSNTQSQSSRNPWGTSNDTNQTSLGNFSTSGSQTEGEVSASDSGGSDEPPIDEPETERDGSSTEAGDADESESESVSESGLGSGGDESPNHESPTASDDRTADTDSSDTTTGDGDGKREDTSTETTSGANEQPPTPTPAHADEDDGLNREGALETDRDAAHDEAERATPDEKALERDLEDIADALDALDEQDGGGAAPGSLSELDIMPDTEGSSTATTAERWGDAAADAEFVGGALRKALKESRRDAHRSGVTSGRFDRRRTAALARGDVDVFQVRQPGDDKQYDLVIILDRSGSMREHIKTAEDALVRFTLACEEIGINVGVIDFINTEARLVKPFSAGSEHVRSSLLSERYGGKTPLADALGLGRELLEQRRNSPLVLVVTDGKPGDEDAYHDELAQSYAPVCGLTLVLDQPTGNVPDKVARNERFYDRHVYVHEPSQLADRLDQFAIMFDGL